MELINQIHKYLFGATFFVAFAHFLYLFFQAYKKLPLAEDITLNEFNRVRKEFGKNRLKYFRIMVRPFLIYLLWAFGLFFYFLIMMLTGLMW
jgi:hypothetical protein